MIECFEPPRAPFLQSGRCQETSAYKDRTTGAQGSRKSSVTSTMLIIMDRVQLMASFSGADRLASVVLGGRRCAEGRSE